MRESEYEAKKLLARANRAFYRSFEALDLDAMGRVWADDDEIQCIHPGWELLTGRECVMRSWELIFANTNSIRFDVTDLTLKIAGDMAWITAIENILSDAGGSRFRSQAVATNLFSRRDGEYRMILHHASPVTQKGFEDLLGDLGPA